MKAYSEQVQEFIKNNVAGRSCRELVELVNNEMGTSFTYSAMRSYKKNHNLQSGMSGGEALKGSSKLFSPEVMEFIKNNAEGKGNFELTELINHKFETNYDSKQIKNYKHRNHISSGIKGFEIGHIPKNKGVKMSPEVYEKCKNTMFKKGQIPRNHKPVGSERFGKDFYKMIKVAEPNVWKMKHVFLWEQYHGLVPSDCVVTFLDGNRKNITIENLALITRKENRMMNKKGLRSSDPELTTTGIALTKLKCAISKKMKTKGD